MMSVADKEEHLLSLTFHAMLLDQRIIPRKSPRMYGLDPSVHPKLVGNSLIRRDSRECGYRVLDRISVNGGDMSSEDGLGFDAYIRQLCVLRSRCFRIVASFQRADPATYDQL